MTIMPIATHCHDSRFEQRLGRLGHAIKAGIEMPRDTTTEECEARLTDIKDHRLAKLGRNKDQVSRAEMAVRLVRWLRNVASIPLVVCGAGQQLHSRIVLR